MANIGEITVEVKTKLTVDNDTALVCLGLLELYCRQNRQTIEVSHTRPANSNREFEVSFNFVDDTELKQMGE